MDTETTPAAKTQYLTAEEAQQAIQALAPAQTAKLVLLAEEYSCPGVIDGDDLLQVALHRVWAGKRRWPVGLNGVTFLVGVMRSIVSAAAKAVQTDPAGHKQEWLEGEIDPVDELASEDINMEDGLILLEDAKRSAKANKQRVDQLYTLFEDNKNAQAVLLYLSEEYTPAQIREELGLDDVAYASLRRLMKRRINATSKGKIK